MRTFLLLLLLATPLVAQTPEATVATLPNAATNARQTFRVTDSLTVGDCTTGGGTKRTRCISNGTIWQSDVDLPDATIIPTDSTHRFVTDTEKSTWNGKQNALGFTPANAANLSNVDNTSDANKPVSTATQTALNLKANVSSLAPSATTDTTNAANISTGVLAFARGGRSGAASTPATTGAMTVSMTTAVVTITPTGAVTFNASGGTTGQTATFIITTSGASSFALTWGTNFKAAGTLATGTVTAKKFSITFICVDGTLWQEIGRTAAM